MKYVLLLTAAIAIFGLFSGSNEQVIPLLQGTLVEPYLLALHNGNSIAFNMSVGFLVSTFFWLIVVYHPERKRRTLLRDNLSRQYQSFKESTIQILLWSAVGTHDSELPNELCDHLKFKDFFNKNNKENWYAALNDLQSNQARMHDILFELEMLASEISYVLNNVNIQNDRVHSFFKRLNENIYRLKASSVYSYDQVKYVGNFLWGIHARWSIIDGQRNDDVIQNMIDSL